MKYCWTEMVGHVIGHLLYAVLMGIYNLASILYAKFDIKKWLKIPLYFHSVSLTVSLNVSEIS